MSSPAACPKIAIVMSVYNGEGFLADQFESLFSQTHENWELLVRDDGSVDGTVKLLEQYAQRDSRVRIVKDGLGNLRPARSFLHLAGLADAEYIAFCDQDDMWFPDKLEVTLAELRASDGRPAMAFTDLEVVDQSLRTLLHPSYHACLKLHPEACTYERLLVEGMGPGCAMMFNRPLRDLCHCNGFLPPTIVMHDWWIVLHAALFGEIRYASKVTMKYRNHGMNASGGARPRSWGGLLRSFFSKKNPWKRVQTQLWQTAMQAEALLEMSGSKMTEYQRESARLVRSTPGWGAPFRVLHRQCQGVREYNEDTKAYTFIFSFPWVVPKPAFADGIVKTT